jgi:hypothetical protein
MSECRRSRHVPTVTESYQGYGKVQHGAGLLQGSPAQVSSEPMHQVTSCRR